MGAIIIVGMPALPALTDMGPTLKMFAGYRRSGWNWIDGNCGILLFVDGWVIHLTFKNALWNLYSLFRKALACVLQECRCCTYISDSCQADSSGRACGGVIAFKTCLYNDFFLHELYDFYCTPNACMSARKIELDFVLVY